MTPEERTEKIFDEGIGKLLEGPHSPEARLANAVVRKIIADALRQAEADMKERCAIIAETHDSYLTPIPPEMAIAGKIRALE